MREFLANIRRDLFDGKLSLYEYTTTVRSILGSARDASQLTYSEWSRLYYEFIG